jgi:hypothetical protein
LLSPSQHFREEFACLRKASRLKTEIHGCNPAVGMHQMRVERLLRILPLILPEGEQY